MEELPERQKQQELLSVADVAAEPYSLLELIVGQCSSRAGVEEAAGLGQLPVAAVELAAERQG